MDIKRLRDFLFMYKNNTINTENDQIGSFKIHHLEYAQIYEYWLNVIETYFC